MVRPRRAGELLKQFNIQGARTELYALEGKKSQTKVGAEAGMSAKQIHNASALAKIPEEARPRAALCLINLMIMHQTAALPSKGRVAKIQANQRAGPLHR